ncbi:MAG TPA: HepT-like ribonuclease domain-containing protein [archaeon]|nr:HepT-like ribonuclease domain-containing protein [archaeon]
MTDKERVAGILGDIKRYVSELETYKIKSVDDLKDNKTFFASSMVAFQMINKVFDLCDDVINSKNLGIPSTYKDIFWLLEKGKIINSQTKDKIWPIMRYRNLLAHEYGEISGKDVLFIIQNLNTISSFIGQLKKHLE